MPSGVKVSMSGSEPTVSVLMRAPVAVENRATVPGSDFTGASIATASTPLATATEFMPLSEV